MSFYRCLSTTVKATTSISNPRPPVVSGIVKQLSKFSSCDELADYSQRPIEYLYPNRMIDACSAHHSTPIDLIKTASELHNQLLVRVGHCLRHFQSIPFLPGANPTLLSLHERYLKLFEQLAQFPPIETKKDEEKFFDLINMFVLQNSDVIGLLSTGCSEAQKYFRSYKIMREFLDSVLQVRLSMRLLAEHYLELHRQQQHNKNSNSSNWCGAICMNFSPAKAVQQCIDDVSAICFETFTVVPHVQIENNIHHPIPYFPSVVDYVLRELLKNSMRALVEYNKAALGNMQNVKAYFEKNRQQPLCKVIIGSDPVDEHFTIAVKDHGGGIDENDEKIFKYMFTGDIVRANSMKEEEEQIDIFSDFQERMVQSSKQMYGYGFGLPICRLYAKFFGGSLTLRQVSRIGADAYLRLGFLHTDSERIKI